MEQIKMLKDILVSINEMTNNYQVENSDFLKQKEGELSVLTEIALELNNCWSQSWIGFHANLYFTNFEEPPTWKYQFDSEWGSMYGIPEYWVEKSYDDIASHIESKSEGFSLNEIHNEIIPLVESIKIIQEFIVTELVVIQRDDYYSDEWKTVQEIEDYKWGVATSTFNQVRAPKNLSSRDSFAIQQGIKIPPHLNYDSQVLSEVSKIKSIEDFIKKVKKLVRKIELKSKLSSVQPQKEALNELINICSKFPSVARQLRSRHSSRSTLEIEDEYDVQDLLHALLKIHFDDIRAEEWTPSYAGGSSRMDFLLKNEQIVVEVKKTRKNLSDREVGEQLLIDIAKYSRHQDCKILVCFIYDPEARIGNLTGLENDLNEMSTDSLLVVTRIEPKK